MILVLNMSGTAPSLTIMNIKAGCDSVIVIFHINVSLNPKIYIYIYIIMCYIFTADCRRL